MEEASFRSRATNHIRTVLRILLFQLHLPGNYLMFTYLLILLIDITVIENLPSFFLECPVG